jgi:flagellar hook assembly protein FlgD
MKKLYTQLIFIIIALVLVTPPTVQAATVKISKSKAILEVDATLKLKLSSADSKVIWKSSKKSIASVASSGVVTAKTEGMATITATFNDTDYSCTVTVVDSNKVVKAQKISDKYTEGKYKVGTDIPEGEYVIFAKDSSGYFSLSVDSNENEIITNDNFDYNTIIFVKKGEYLKLSRAYAIPLEAATINADKSGFFKIGENLPAGEYKVVADANASAYYCIYNDNRQDEIESNDNFNGDTYVTVQDGQYLKLSRCKIQK